MCGQGHVSCGPGAAFLEKRGILPRLEDGTNRPFEKKVKVAAICSPTRD